MAAGGEEAVGREGSCGWGKGPAGGKRGLRAGKKGLRAGRGGCRQGEWRCGRGEEGCRPGEGAAGGEKGDAGREGGGELGDGGCGQGRGLQMGRGATEAAGTEGPQTLVRPVPRNAAAPYLSNFTSSLISPNAFENCRSQKHLGDILEVPG